MILSRHIATAHLPSCCTTCAALFFMTGRNTESLIVNANIQALFVAECQPTVFMFPIIWEVFKKIL